MEDHQGQIRGETDTSSIDRQRWVQLIAAHPKLMRPASRNATNPFTKKPVIIQPPEDTARVIVDGKVVGTMTWALDGSERIDVFGEPKSVIPVALEIARVLGGRFQPGDDELPDACTF
jgi:hypothetical protein